MPPVAPPNLAPTPDTDIKVLAEKARAIQSDTHWRMGSYVICTWVAGWMLFDPDKAVFIWLWLGTVMLMSVLNVLEEVHAKRHPPPPEQAERRLRAATRSGLIFGSLWAVGVLLLWPAQRIDLQVFLMFLTAGLTAGAQLSISVNLPTFYAFFVPALGSLIVVTLWTGGAVNYLIAFATTVYLVASVRFVKTQSEMFVGAMRARFEIADLAESLQRQKEVAEEASQSKSRFLAAASHDLRQPVHSLSLFLGALASQPQSTEGARLLGHLQSTVDGLGTMFNALLNISKLDANTIQPEWATVDLQHLLKTVCETEGVVARDKGLALRLSAPHLGVKTDPGLLDRVLRNLVANAVRYTDHGTVVISARIRAGQVLMRVGDTGIGIPQAQHEAVFDEFVQLHNPERDRNNGLGLGLAIVRRLTALLQIRLQLRSRVGRGSVFSLWLGAPVALPPLVNTQVSLEPTSEPKSPAQPVGQCLAEKTLVFVVDDDAGIRTGASALLTAWGYEVVAVGGLAELLPITATCHRVPSLVICDLRLRNGENGIETVEALRTHYNEDLPAILITGDTDPERLQQAQQSGLLLLHKPVSPDALKEAMAQAASPLHP